jgi:hypothetical protein
MSDSKKQRRREWAAAATEMTSLHNSQKECQAKKSVKVVA